MSMVRAFINRNLWLAVCTAIVAGCGGGSSTDTPTSTTPSNAPLPESELVRVSQTSPYPKGCGVDSGGVELFEDSVVEPYEAVNPANASNVIGIWQQDRWSGGGAHGLVEAYSMDGGKHWTEQPMAFSACATGSGGFARASDPWVSFSPDGTAYAVSISFTGTSLAPNASGTGVVYVMKSSDGGATWSGPTTLIADGSDAFDDKESVTADPNDSHYAYVVWDRLDSNGRGPTYFSRTTDGGDTWSTAAPIYDPGVNNQTIGNEVIGLSDGSIVDLFEELDSNLQFGLVRIIRSTDHGSTWSAPVTVAEDLAVGTPGVRDGAGLPQGAASPGGGLVVVWQDGRFGTGTFDGIALSRSADAGKTWSAPVEVNRVPTVAAFTPSVAVLADGTIGVTYFDWCNENPNSTTTMTDYWFVSSSDAVHWSEQHISGSFDLNLAPYAGGLFLGDYQALAVVANVFTPFYVQTNRAGSTDSTDAYVLPPQPVPLALSRRVTHLSIAAPAVQMSAAFRARVHSNVERLMRDENPREDLMKLPGGNTSPP